VRLGPFSEKSRNSDSKFLDSVIYCICDVFSFLMPNVAVVSLGVDLE